MYEWQKQIQMMVDEIDRCIKNHEDDALTLRSLAEKCGYSPFYMTRRFKEIAGISLRDYLSRRKLAFALVEVRDTSRSFLDIALDCGFSSHEAFTRAFKKTYGVTPTVFRQNPTPVVLRTQIRPYDCYFLGMKEHSAKQSTEEVKIYFVTIPAHKFLHVKNRESIGYWDFWRKMAEIPGCDCETVCGLLGSIPNKLDDMGDTDLSSGSGQIMGFINDPAGRICSWGIPLAESYGVRLPADYNGPIPPQMLLCDVDESEYLVFEHGPFSYETESESVEQKIESAMASFDYAASGYQLDLTEGRIMYFFHDEKRFWKYIRPVKKI